MEMAQSFMEVRRELIKARDDVNRKIRSLQADISDTELNLEEPLKKL